jgi:HEAT repeat protein
MSLAKVREDRMQVFKRWLQTRSIHSSESGVRINTVAQLATSKDKNAVGLLIEALQDPDAGVRCSAATALGKRCEARAVQPLLDQLLVELEIDVAQEIKSAVAKFAPRRIAVQLAKGLDDEDMRVQQTAAAALRELCWPSLDDETKARIAILQEEWEEAAQLGKAAVQPLKTTLIEGTQHAKRIAAKALGEIGSFHAYKALLSVLEDDAQDESTRKIAAWAFRTFSWEWLEDAHLAMVAVVLEDWSNVANLGESAVDLLITVLQDKSSRVRERAAEALGEIATREAIGALVVARSDEMEDHVVREAAAGSLKKVATAMLTYPDLTVRSKAAGILTDLGWQPKTDEDRVLVAIACGEWPKVGEAGSAAIDPLMRLVADSVATQETADTLVRAIELGGRNIPTMQLHELASMSDYRIGPGKPTSVRGRTVAAPARTVDCSKVRHAAQIEMARQDGM